MSERAHEVDSDEEVPSDRRPVRRVEGALPALRRGRLEAISVAGEILVDLAGSVRAAALATACSDAEVINAVRDRKEVLLGCIDDDPDDLVILGIVRRRIEVRPAADAASPSVRERFVEIAASETISLRAGDSSLELRADGRVEIRAVEIVSIAEGTNRIVGARVAVN